MKSAAAAGQLQVHQRRERHGNAASFLMQSSRQHSISLMVFDEASDADTDTHTEREREREGERRIFRSFFGLGAKKVSLSPPYTFSHVL